MEWASRLPIREYCSPQRLRPGLSYQFTSCTAFASLSLLSYALLLPIMTWLPLPLLAVIQSFLLLAEAQQKLSLDTAADFNTNSLPNPPTFSVPSNGNALTVAVALCATSSGPPRFFVTNDTTIPQPSVSDVDNVNTYEIVVGPEGFGSRQLMFTNGGIISVSKGSTATPFEMVVSTNSKCQPRLLYMMLYSMSLEMQPPIPRIRSWETRLPTKLSFSLHPSIRRHFSSPASPTIAFLPPI